MAYGFRLEKQEVQKGKRLSDQEIKNLIKEYQQTNSKETQEEIIKNSLHMVSLLTRLYCKNKENYDDDYQAGVTALLLAIKKFDTGRGVQWNTFAIKCIRRAIKREHEKRKLEYTTCPLTGSTQNEKDRGKINIIQDDQNIEEELLEKELIQEIIKKAKEILTEREFEALTRYYGLNGEKKKTYKQMAKEEGKSGSTIRTQVERGIKKIKKYMSEGYKNENQCWIA